MTRWRFHAGVLVVAVIASTPPAAAAPDCLAYLAADRSFHEKRAANGPIFRAVGDALEAQDEDGLHALEVRTKAAGKPSLRVGENQIRPAGRPYTPKPRLHTPKPLSPTTRPWPHAMRPTRRLGVTMLPPLGLLPPTSRLTRPAGVSLSRAVLVARWAGVGNYCLGRRRLVFSGGLACLWERNHRNSNRHCSNDKPDSSPDRQSGSSCFPVPQSRSCFLPIRSCRFSRASKKDPTYGLGQAKRRSGPLTARTDPAESKARGKGDHWASHDRALARARESTGTARLDGPGGGMDCACLSPQWSFHAGAVLSLLQYPTNDGVAFREGIDRTTGGGRNRCNCLQRRRKDVPNFRQGDLPGAWS